MTAMRRATRVLLVALLAATLLAPAEGARRDRPAWAAPKKGLVLVDSVLLGGMPDLRDAMPDWRLRMQGRPALMVRVARRQLQSRRRVTRLVVIGLGYNSLWQRHRHRYRYWSHRFDSEAHALLRTLKARGARQFVWVTLREPTRSTVPSHARAELSLYSWYFPYVNERLRRIDRARGDLVLADWAAVSRRNGLTFDSIHVNRRGGRLLGKTIEIAIRGEARRQRQPKPSWRAISSSRSLSS